MLDGLKSILPDTFILLSFVFCLASTNSKSFSFKNSEELNKPAFALGANTKGFAFKSTKTSSLTFHIPIAEGSSSSTLLSSPEIKYPKIELPLVPSVFLFFNKGPDKEKPNKL